MEVIDEDSGFGWEGGSSWKQGINDPERDGKEVPLLGALSTLRRRLRRDFSVAIARAWLPFRLVLLLPLHPSVLKPDLYLPFRQT